MQLAWEFVDTVVEASKILYSSKMWFSEDSHLSLTWMHGCQFSEIPIPTNLDPRPSNCMGQDLWGRSKLNSVTFAPLLSVAPYILLLSCHNCRLHCNYVVVVVVVVVGGGGGGGASRDTILSRTRIQALYVSNPQ